MLKFVDVKQEHSLDDYAGNADLTGAVHELRAEASVLVPRLDGSRRLWMVNSTEQGGGVAEMLPMVVSLLRELGVPTEWAVIGTERSEFFTLTKQLHNLIHGVGNPTLSLSDLELYESVSRELADEFRKHLSPEDLLVIHDPQPAGMGALLKKETGVHAVWRSHIGLDETTAETQAAWEFLKPYVRAYDHVVFSAPEYIPDYLTGNVSIIHPAVDPLSFKNRPLSPHMVTGVLCNADLMREHHPVLLPRFEPPASRLQPDGTFGRPISPEGIGLLFRTIITQISRWDRLKGWEPLLEAFVQLKRDAADGRFDLDERQRRRIEIARLVLAGPEPAAVQDDPEAQEVLEHLCARYCALPPSLQKDVVLLSLPMASRENNALMVNALQRCSSIVVQNSIQEGFGLTATEAMWKRVAVLGSSACGLRQQIRDGVDGRLIGNPADPEEVELSLLELLNDNETREAYGRSAQHRVHNEFLVFAQVRRWLEMLTTSLHERRHGQGRKVSQSD